jgi:hypothetical protein
MTISADPVHMNPGAETFYVPSGEFTQTTPQGVNHISAGQSLPGYLSPMRSSPCAILAIFIGFRISKDAGYAPFFSALTTIA